MGLGPTENEKINEFILIPVGDGGSSCGGRSGVGAGDESPLT